MILAAWEEILQWLPVYLTKHIRRPGLSVLGWYNQRFVSRRHIVVGQFAIMIKNFPEYCKRWEP